MGKAAFDFIDFLVTSGQHYWQILPLSITDECNSPYSSCSIYACNPLLIDLDLLFEDGLISKTDLSKINISDNENIVDFDLVKESHMILIKKAASKLSKKLPVDFDEFMHNNKWLEDYGLYMALKDAHNGDGWYKWPEEYKLCNYNAIERAKIKYNSNILLHQVIQYIFYKQWKLVKEYAYSHNIEIIGDCPIYVAYDSVEVWRRPDLFELDEHRKPTFVAGVPGDYFAPEGQVWNGPLYNYTVMEQDGYNWWLNRIQHLCDLYDVLRIDHFRAFESYFTIPAGDKTATNGSWKKGPGMNLFNSVKYWLGDKKIIAEDLGMIDDAVRNLLKETGYPGMKVLQFAFNCASSEPSNYLPHRISDRNSVAYIGTHDNATLMEWLATSSDEDISYAKTYIGNNNDDDFCRDMIRCLESCNSDVVIIMMQDLLELGSEARMNTPGREDGNWTFRIAKDYKKNIDIKHLYDLTKAYERL